MARRRVNTTKLDIIQVATRMFLEKGVSETSAKAVADALEISTGNLTFHFPTKEHLVAVLVKKLCLFQQQMMKRYAQEGAGSVLSVCLELAAMASSSEQNPVAKDVYLSAYSHPMAMDIIRHNDKERAKAVFGCYCPDWTDEQFQEAEILVSGIEYATLMTTADSATLEMRIRGALNSIMLIYNVPEEIREDKIAKVLALDYKDIGNRVFEEFLHYTAQLTEDDIEELLQP